MNSALQDKEHIIIAAIKRRNMEIRLPYFFYGRYGFEYRITLESRSLNAKTFRPTIVKPYERDYWLK